MGGFQWDSFKKYFNFRYHRTNQLNQDA